jgi:hypothetical protein
LLDGRSVVKCRLCVSNREWRRSVAAGCFQEQRWMAKKKDKERVVPTDPGQSRVDSSTDYQAPGKVSPSDLVKLARDALQEKRLRNCLTLTAAILKIDPENKDAHVIESWVYADLEQEFKGAVRLAEGARRERNRASWAGVQTSLRRILNVLPDHEGAKTLLAEALSSSHLREPEPEVFPEFSPSAAPVRGYERVEKSSNRKMAVGLTLLFLLLVGSGYVAFKRWQPIVGAIRPGSANSENRGTLAIQADDGLQIFVDSQYRGTAPLEPLALAAGTHQLAYKANGALIAQEEIEVPINGTVANTMAKLVGRLDLLLVPTTGVELSIDNGAAAPAPGFVLLKPGAHQLSFSAEGRNPEVRNVMVMPGDRSLLPILLREQAATDNRDNRDRKNAPAAPAAVPPPVAKKADAGEPPAPPPPKRIAQPRGQLAITSSVPAQIYADGRLLGTTPATLEFPEGTLTLEYRYENLSKKMTHTVKIGETTPVNVVIDTALQINAQPWAEVFIQDGKNSPLGQTPLSGVRVPVGTTLIFRNPRYNDKLYRVSAKDTTISVVFP